jgi:hypothetical protein
VKKKDLQGISAHTCSCSIIHNSQEVEATQMSIHKWTEKQNVINTYNILKEYELKYILYTYLKGRKSYHNVLGGHFAKWNNPVTKKDKYYTISLTWSI